MTGDLSPLVLGLLAGGLVVAGAWIGWPGGPRTTTVSETVGLEEEILVEPGMAVDRAERWTVPLDAPPPGQADLHLPTIAIRQLAFGEGAQGAVIETVVRLDGREIDRLEMDTTEPPSDMSWRMPREPVVAADRIGPAGGEVEIVVSVTRPGGAAGTLVILAGPVELTTEVPVHDRSGLAGVGWLTAAAAGASGLTYLTATVLIGRPRRPGLG